MHSLPLYATTLTQNIISLPFYDAFVSCGFTSPADDFEEKSLSLDDKFIPNPNSTFFVRASGDSMEGAGIYRNDLLIVDRACRVRNNDVVLAIVDGEFTVKYFCKTKSGDCFLRAANSSYPDIIWNEYCEISIWGVVTYVIHGFR